MYKIFLEGEGFDVIITQDGVDCLEQYRMANQNNTPFDIVILDYRMPRMDGRAAALEILAINPCQIIVMITAYGRGIGDYSGLEKVEVLQKPFELENLGNVLRSLLLAEKSVKKAAAE